MKFERISVEQGLSQSLVTSLAQDARGFMWFGTQQGLNRYDGNKIRIYQNDPQENTNLKSSAVLYLLKDKFEKLWVGTFANEICNYDSINDSFIYHDTGLKDDIVERSITISSMATDSGNNLWIGTLGRGLIRYDIKTGRSKIYRKKDKDENSIAGDDVLCVYVDDDDKIWAGTRNNGISIFNKLDNTFKNIDLIIDASNAGKHSRINDIYRDSRGELLVSTNFGIKGFDLSEEKFTDQNFLSKENAYLKNDFIKQICEDKNNNLWIGTKNHGAFFRDMKNNKLENFRSVKTDIFTIGDNNISKMFNDSSNVMWFGTIAGGVSRADCEKKKFHTVKEIMDTKTGHSGDKITAFLEDGNNNLWVGTYGEGLFKKNTKTNVTVNFRDGSDDNSNYKGPSVFSMLKDNNTDLWIGVTTNGINKYDHNTNTFQNFRIPDTVYNEVSCILDFNSYQKNKILIGTTGSGMFLFDTVKLEFEPFSINNATMKNDSLNSVKCMYIDSEDYLWVGMLNQGLMKIDLNNNEITYYKKGMGSISDNYISVITEDKYKQIWIGTRSKGLIKYNRSKGMFTHYNLVSGLPNNVINGILEDEKGFLWISTNKGISKFDSQKETFINFGSDDGLQSNEFNEYAYYRSPDGYLYFGGVEGYNYFKPEEIELNPYIPEIVITDLQIFNSSVMNSPDNKILKKSISETKEINITYRESVFSLGFSSLIFNNPSKNQFAYKMEGFDKEWIYCRSRNYVTYTNLEPGEYLFRVKGTNNDGVWNEKGTSLKIKISPPFWKTWWFKSLGVISVMGATGAAYNKKLSNIEKEKKQQEIFSRKLMASQEEERKRIATDLHDTIAHDILITKNKAVLGLKKAEGNVHIESVLNEISDLASGTLKDIRSISYNLHPHQIERLGMTKAIRSIINSASDSCDIDFKCNIDNIDKLLPAELEINVFRIIQECVNNILKHSGATKASLKVTKDSKSLTIRVRDNGKGMSVKRIDGLGLTGIKERVNLYNGKLEIGSIPTKETVIKISLPLNFNK